MFWTICHKTSRAKLLRESHTCVYLQIHQVIALWVFNFLSHSQLAYTIPCCISFRWVQDPALADVLLNSMSLQIITLASHRHSLQWRLQACFFVWLCLKVRSDLVVHSKRLLLILFLPVFGLYCIYSMNIQTTPNRKTKAQLISRGRQTCASPNRSLPLIHVVRFAHKRCGETEHKHYIKEVQLIIEMFGSNRCLEATKQQRINAETRDVSGIFYQAVQWTNGGRQITGNILSTLVNLLARFSKSYEQTIFR